MLISRINIAQSWRLSGCAMIPHPRGNEIAQEVKAGGGYGKRRPMGRCRG
jgi:N-methylhydantoinase B/oxoprolinase/acetone carboxylase alpha subunit